jgi:hypothetical protein
MKKAIYTIAILFALISCREDDVNLFDKTADERAAEAISNLKQELISPPNGWKVEYTPQDGSGSYYVLMRFNEDNKVVIQTDLGADDGKYFEDTVSYRIDNSLGLELIIENYSFFSYLFEQDAATFGAEYEFNYVNKTPDNALVFNSKSDVTTPSIILFEPASTEDLNVLGIDLARNLNIMAQDLDKFTSSLKLTYQNKDLALFISLDERRRTLTVTSASLKSNTTNMQSVGFSTPYIIKGDSIVFNERLEGTILGTAVSIKSIQLNSITEGTISICADPITLHAYSGVTSSNEPVVLETTLLDINGKSFAEVSDFYFTPLDLIFNNGVTVNDQITQDVAGALEMHMYYGYDIGADSLLYGIGFVIQNMDGTITFALREFTPVVNDNNLVFNFKPTISLFGNRETDANIENINIYLNALSQGDKTFVFQLNDSVYEFYNPCTGWSFVLINANQ